MPQAGPAIFLPGTYNLKMFTGKIWWSFIVQKKMVVTRVLLLGFASSYLTLLIPLSIGKFLDIVFAAGTSKTKALQLLGINLPDNLSTFFYFFFSLLFAKFIISWLHQYTSAVLGEQFAHQLKSGLFEAQMNTADKKKPSSLLVYSNDARAIQQLLTKGVLGFIKDAAFAAMTLYVLFSLSDLLTAQIIALLTLFYYFYRKLALWNKKAMLEKRKKQAALLTHISKSLLDEALPAEEPTKSYTLKAKKLEEALKTFHFQKSFLRALPSLLLYGILGIVMLTVASGVIQKKLPAGDVITYILILMILFPTLRNILKVSNTWLLGEASGKKFNPHDVN